MSRSKLLKSTSRWKWAIAKVVENNKSAKCECKCVCCQNMMLQFKKVSFVSFWSELLSIYPWKSQTEISIYWNVQLQDKNIRKQALLKDFNCKSYGLWWEKTCLLGLRTTKAQSSLRICTAFVIHVLESIIIQTCYMRNFNFLASLCTWGDWFESRFVGAPKTGFIAMRPVWARSSDFGTCPICAKVSFNPLLHRLFLDHFLFLDNIEKIQEKIKKNLSKVLNTSENITENGAFAHFEQMLHFP